MGAVPFCIEELDARMILRLKLKIPNGPDLFSVFSVSAFCVYGWMIFLFIYILPTWSLYVPVSEIIAYFAYSAVGAGIDTILLTLISLGVIIFQPITPTRERFVLRATMTPLLLFGAMTVVQLALTIDKSNVRLFALREIFWIVVPLVHLILARRNEFVKREIAWFYDSVVIFGFLFSALFVLGLVAVIARNVG